MGLTRSYLVSLLLYISVVNEIRLPQVTCQDEESTQCIPKTEFLALLRLPEVRSNLAAYSRTARVIQNAKNRNEMAHLVALIEGVHGSEICVPGGIYMEFFRDPAMRGHLSVIDKTEKLPDFLGRLLEDTEEIDTGDLLPDFQKRSLAMLAKNGDLPNRGRGQSEDDQEKRSIFMGEQSDRNSPEILREYFLSNGDLDEEAPPHEFPLEKRNVGSLARDFALPTGRRNLGSLARDYGLPSGKRNIGSLARERALPAPTGKRNLGSVARDYGLPYGDNKRYLGSLARIGSLPSSRDSEKRSVAALARNGLYPSFSKRGWPVPGTSFATVLPYKYGGGAKFDGTKLDREASDEDPNESRARSRPSRQINASQRRQKRQLDFSDEYPLPVMQNTNALDYEEMMEELAGQYFNAEKRFMGSAPEMQASVAGYPETIRASKRHIGSLARLGWLPSLRPARFSRSPRYLVGREDPADGASSDYSSNSSTRSLRPNINPRTRYLQALHGNCQHGFKRFLLLPTDDNVIPHTLPRSPKSI